MSQKYTCKVKVAESVKADDHIRQKIDLQNILDPEDMKALMRQELEKDGWVKDGECDVYVKTEDDIESVMDMESMEVTHTLEKTHEVNEEISATADTWDLDKSKKLAKEAAKKRKKELLDKTKAKVEGEVRQQLTEVEKTKTEEMARILRGVYSEALKQKARKIGEVVSQTEGTNQNGEYELVIKVEL